MKKKNFTHLTRMLIIALFFVMSSKFAIGQVAGDFRSIASGNWNATTTWESYDGSVWSAASSTPTATNSVYLQIGFTVTLTQNEACNDLHINAGASTIVALSTFTLEVNGKLRNYTGALGTIPGTSSTTVTNGCITSTAGSGKIKFVGTTRTILVTGEWGNNPQGWDAEFAPTAGNILSIQTGFKARNITVSSGTVTSSSADMRPDGNAAGTGTLTVKSGSLLQFSGATINIKRIGSAGATSHFGTLTVESGAVLDFSGNSSPVIGASAFALNGTVKYSGVGAQTLAVKGGNTAGVDINTYTNLYLTGGGIKTLGIATFVNGTLTLAGTASLALGAFTLTYGALSSLEYASSAIQTTALTEFPVTGVNNLIINNPSEVIIDATRSITGDVTLYPLSNLTINAAASLTVAGTFLLQSDITGTGSFIDNGTMTVTSGIITVQKYLPDTRWWYIGSPMVGANASAFGTLSAVPSTGKRLSFYDEPNQTYTAVADGATLGIALRGYSFRNFDAGATTAAFTGVLNTAAIGAPGNLSRVGVGAYDGFNLVCNPYPSAINWGTDNTPTPGLTKTTLESTIWYRTNGSFATYNSSGDGTGVNGGQQIIPAMQAFWVRVALGNTTGGIQVANTTRLHSSQAFYKKTAETNIFRMVISNGINTDETAVGFYTNALNTFENYDSEKMFYTDEDVPQIYSLTSDNTKTAINGQAELTPNEERIIPLGFSTPVSGTFTFVATNLNDFDANVSVYLEDTQLSVIQDLRQSNTYTFTSAITDDANRFKVHFGNMTTDVPTITESAVSAYAVDNTIYVNTPKTASIKVYDVLGNLIMTQNSTQGLNTLHMNVDLGIYIVTIQTGTQVATQKVMISK